jgi:hypothetical protein
MRGLPGRGGIGPPTALDVRCPECMGDERDGKDCSGNGRHDMRGATHVINGTCVKCGEGGTFSATPNGRLSTGRLSTTGTSTLNSLARKHAAGKEYVLTDRGRSLRILEVRDINELEEEVAGVVTRYSTVRRTMSGNLLTKATVRPLENSALTPCVGLQEHGASCGELRGATTEIAEGQCAGGTLLG